MKKPTKNSKKRKDGKLDNRSSFTIDAKLMKKRENDALRKKKKREQKKANKSDDSLLDLDQQIILDDKDASQPILTQPVMMSTNQDHNDSLVDNTNQFRSSLPSTVLSAHSRMNEQQIKDQYKQIQAQVINLLSSSKSKN